MTAAWIEVAQKSGSEKVPLRSSEKSRWLSEEIVQGKSCSEKV
jgi:hypothetical protein